MSYGPAGFGFAFFVILLWVVGTVLLTWLLVLAIVVGHRWLRLNPAPSRGGSVSYQRADAAPRPADDIRHHFGPDLRAWASANESPAALAQRLSISGTAAAQVIELAQRAAAGTATDAEWEQLRPWLPKLLGRD
ncbi:hypothetical protein [Gryllotalpicola protaetiae]|uniref:Uncharacterized protein n=1 Tax=Gryllotalpicola protaetiae TaxID=2419771 RepID=A0A387BQY0_9MICO|nr:hypothetical protein [Gryllotalpicola protaetiae]AYG03396.1 hypothetical protein D7I44_07525 [Gryllotalpicola protaetiae]